MNEPRPHEDDSWEVGHTGPENPTDNIPDDGEPFKWALDDADTQYIQAAGVPRGSASDEAMARRRSYRPPAPGSDHLVGATDEHAELLGYKSPAGDERAESQSQTAEHDTPTGVVADKHDEPGADKLHGGQAAETVAGGSETAQQSEVAPAPSRETTHVKVANDLLGESARLLDAMLEESAEDPVRVDRIHALLGNLAHLSNVLRENGWPVEPFLSGSNIQGGQTEERDESNPYRLNLS